jgi:hypothetical protein
VTYILKFTVLCRRINQRIVNKLTQVRPLLGTVMNIDTLRMLVDEKLVEIRVRLGLDDYPQNFLTHPAQMTWVSSFKFIVHPRRTSVSETYASRVCVQL